MYRALYDYNSTRKGYLTFVKGDDFSLLDKKHGDWLLAQNGFGEVGYVPATYISKDEHSSLSQVVKSIDRALQAIHYAASSTGSLTHEQRENLRSLTQHRENVLKSAKSEPRVHILNSAKSESTEKKVQQSISEPTRRTSSKRSAPPPPARNSQLSSTDISSSSSSTSTGSSSTSPSIRTDLESSRSSSSSLLSEDSKQNETKPNITSGTNSSLIQGTRNRNHLDDIDTESHQFSDVDVYGGGPEQKEEPIHFVEHQFEDVNSPTGNSYIVISRDDSETTVQRTLPAVQLSSSPSKNLQQSPSRFLKSPSVIKFESITVPGEMASDMVEQLREHTGLSYPKSCLAVEIVLGQVAARLPQMASVMDKILMTFSEGESKNEESSYDGKTLQDLLTKLTECKDDAQQRSWSLFADQQTISEYLDELLSILENAKSSVCRKVIAKNRYEALHNLVEYYQMETRVSLRMTLLKCFGAMCSLEASIVSNLLYSILPLELVSEIQNKYDNLPLLCYVAIVLSMILSTGEPLPTSLSDHITKRFIGFIFELIEKPPSQQFEDEASDQLIVVLLALNLHYTEHTTNPVMEVLADKGTVKTFTEKLLLLFNRGDDPVKMFEFQTCQQNSVMKFVTDLYRDKSTASLLYTNDAKVLVDMIIRMLTDLQPGDEVRTNNLILANLFVENSDYLEYKHRESEFCRCLHNILHEESSQVEDKNIVGDILDQIQDFT
ncbi:NCK-interacting protein with SH3 domain-like [Mytilus galloprovincialis]|uniref:NCK-interacting protein with SH3 domain-like n=1 Tax=Mytilus galloprovincialis TaxID=29158 RepID=UPI003F7B4A63